MIHTCKLPRVNRKRLTTIVRLQLDLLRFAIFTDECDDDHCRDYFDKGECIYSVFQGRGKMIVDDWLWKPRTTARHCHLVNFARACSDVRNGGGDAAKEKDIPAWFLYLYGEVESLLNPRCITFAFGKHFDYPDKPKGNAMMQKRRDGLLHWKEYAKDFLLFFYETYLGGNKDHFPAGLFLAADAEDYGRQEFLSEFFKKNTHLDICPFCDEVLLSIRSQKLISTDIDHFLPKERYPHLACHPYNLVPACNPCNSRMKNTHDPLSKGGQRLLLRRESFPYGKTKMHSHGYLKVTFTKEEEISSLPDQAIHIQSMELVPHNHLQNGIAKTDIYEIIDLLEILYKIPERWRERKSPGMYRDEKDGLASQICETLMRRIHQSLGSALRQDPYDCLTYLLYQFGRYDLGKDPHVFAMLWILTAWLKEEIRPALDSGQRSLLCEEIAWWPNYYMTPGKERADYEERADYVENLFKQLEG